MISPTNASSIHLHHQPRLTKSRGRIDCYSLASCYRDVSGKNQKKILMGIGELNPFQARQYKILLKALNRVSHGLVETETILADLSKIKLEYCRNYLDVLILSELWEKLEIGRVLRGGAKYTKEFDTEKVARVLTINRLLRPLSKIGTIKWFRKTWLAKILGVEVRHYNKGKIFRSLSQIHAMKSELEKYFFKFTRDEARAKDIMVYYFDGTTSWFEGSKCQLSHFDKEKTRGYYDQVVGFMLVTDSMGYPVAWEVVSGNCKDTTAFKALAFRIFHEYGVKEITYCFDRGVASADNFARIDMCKSKFISAIRNNQIKDVFDLEKFQSTRLKLLDEAKQRGEKRSYSRKIVCIDGFYQFGFRTFYCDLGIKSNNLRYIVSFNIEIFEKAQKERTRNIELTLRQVNSCNHELASAKGDRDYNATERELIQILSKLKTKKIFSYKLFPIVTANKVQSFRIELSFKTETIHESQLSDGILVYVTDHIEKHELRSGSLGYYLPASAIIQRYKEKYIIENAFRELKSFIDLRPIYVWTVDHVKAHYDIAVAAYFINNYIYRKLKPLNVGLRIFFELLDEYAKAVEIVSPDGVQMKKVREPGEDLTTYLNVLGIGHIPVASNISSIQVQ